MSSVELTDERKKEIGQHFVFGFLGTDLDENLRRLIQDYYVGHLILMKRNVRDGVQTRRLIRGIQTLAKEAGHPTPILIGTDQENGLVSPTTGTQFPGAMALAATGSADLAEKVTNASGKELASVDVHWAYSPVADVNSNPHNPVIGVRSYGDDAHKVSGFVQAVSKGLTQASVAPCAKHFPGHGDTNVDSHLALPVISKSRNDLYSNELIPFQRLISSGIPSIMTAHIALPEITGSLVPASLSREITTDLLRTEMGYNGIIVTDCLEMDAVMKTYGSERAALESLKAGADIAMICHTLDKQIGAVELVWEAFRSGELSRDELQQSTHRIERLKGDFAGSWDDFLSTSITDEAFTSLWSQLLDENKFISQQGYQRSTAIISNPPGVLPLSTTDTVLLFTPIMESLNRAVDDAEDVLRTANGLLRNTKGASYSAFASAIGKRVKVQHIVYSQELPSSSPYSPTAIIFTMRNADRSPWQIDYLKNILHILGREETTSRSGIVPKVVLLSSCQPYDLIGVPDIDLENVAHVASFEFTIPALETATSVIFGEIPAQGNVPVTIT